MENADQPLNTGEPNTPDGPIPLRMVPPDLREAMARADEPDATLDQRARNDLMRAWLRADSHESRMKITEAARLLDELVLQAPQPLRVKEIRRPGRTPLYSPPTRSAE